MRSIKEVEVAKPGRVGPEHSIPEIGDAQGSSDLQNGQPQVELIDLELGTLDGTVSRPRTVIMVCLSARPLWLNFSIMSVCAAGELITCAMRRNRFDLTCIPRKIMIMDTPTVRPSRLPTYVHPIQKNPHPVLTIRFVCRFPPSLAALLAPYPCPRGGSTETTARLMRQSEMPLSFVRAVGCVVLSWRNK